MLGDKGDPNLSFLAITLCLGILGCRSGVETPPRARDSTSVPFDADKALGSWVDLWNTYDLSKVDDLFLTDDRVTYFSSEKEGLIQGIEAVREHHRGFGFVPGGKTSERELWVEDVNVVEHGKAAVVTGIWFFGRRSDAPENIQRGPVTFVYVLDEDQYRLAHLHFARY